MALSEAEKAKMREKQVDALNKFLKDGGDWSEKPIKNLSSFVIVRRPETKTRAASLAIRVIPEGKKGVYVASNAEVEHYKTVFNDPRLKSLIALVSEANGVKTSEAIDALEFD
jgi:hypothetical protein